MDGRVLVRQTLSSLSAHELRDLALRLVEQWPSGDTTLAAALDAYLLRPEGELVARSRRRRGRASVARWARLAGRRLPTLPTGRVTFLLADVESSTRLWEQYPEAMREAQIRNDAIAESAAECHDGCLVRPRGEGDSHFCVFPCPISAVAAAATIQEALHHEAWLMPEPLRVRMALHTGEADLRDGDYYGPVVNRCARLRGIAHGGQVLLSGATYALVRESPPSGVSFLDLGEHHLADIAVPERVHQILISSLPTTFPPLKCCAAAAVAAGRSP